MADYDNRAFARTASAGVIDAGLRAHMLRVYNYMLFGLVLTGATAWLRRRRPRSAQLFYPAQCGNRPEWPVRPRLGGAVGAAGPCAVPVVRASTA